MKRIFLFWLSYLLSLSAFAQESDLSNPSNPTIARTLTGIHVFDANNAVIVGQSGTILKTTDGGTNWTIKNSGTNLPLLAVHFADPINGWAVGEDRIILKSSNGGNSWMQQFSTELSTFAEDVYFVNADTGLAAGILGFNNMLRTFDGGQTWTGVSLGVAWVKQVHFVDARHGWAVGITASFISISVFGDIIIQNPRSTIWRTIDGGATWSVMLSGPVRNTPEWLRGVFFTDLNTGWIVGDNNVILKTTDGGVTWNPQSSGTSNNLWSVDFVDASTGWIVGSSGRILKTANGGTTWTAQSSGTSRDLQAVSFANILVGWAVGSNGIILKTIDGGVTWNPQPTAPAAPTLFLPSNGGQNQPITLTFSWSNEADATSYRLQISPDPSFATTVFDDSTITVSQKQVGPLDYNTTYYWRVSAKNAAGASPYSPVWRFTTMRLMLPAAPALVSPSNGAGNQSTTLTLFWTSSAGATTYRLQVATTPTFTTTVFDDSTLTTTAQQIGPLTNNTIYYWRVNAKNAAGISGYSATWSFSTLGFAAPTLVSPPNNATNQPTTLTLVWNPSTGATTYRLQLATTPTFTTTAFDDSIITTTSQQVGPLNGNTIYYWRVNAKNAAETSSYSALWNFTTTMTAPSAPSLVSPLNGAINQPFILTLRWNRSTSAVTYRLQVSTTPSFVNTVFDDSTLVPTSRTIYRLNNDVTYYWRVKAKNALGESPYSEIWNFTIEKRIWGLQNSGAFNDLTSVSFVDTLTGWVVGAAGTILKTNDAGITWRQQSSGTNVELRSVHFIDTSLGWAVGIAGAVLKTTDGGEHWTPQTSGVSTGLNFVYFVNATTGWVAGDNGKILKTTDRGASWVAQTSGISTNLIAVQFVDISTGWALGSVLLRTSDGGANWLAYTAPNGRRTFHFIDATTGWAAGGGGEIFKTIDSGLSWQRIRRGDGNSLSSIRFIDAINGWAVGSFGQIIKTTDGGTNWIDQASGTAEDLRSVHFVNAKLGWAVGQHGVILKTPISSVVSVDENLEPNSTTPTDIVLEQNYPNPFNPSTTISFSLRRAEFVTLRVFNIRGEEVARLIEKQLAAGAHQVQWNASAFVSGVYCYRLQIRNLVQMRKLLLLK